MLVLCLLLVLSEVKFLAMAHGRIYTVALWEASVLRRQWERRMDPIS
jgi:hypothetical protein